MPNSLASFLSAKNLALYGTISIAAAVAVVFNAFRERSNFYAATVMLSRSNGSMLILLNLGLFFAIVSSRITQLIFFGALRPVEVEHIYERCSFSIGESLIALTIFRDQFDVGFFAIFVELLFAKIFHWLCSDRVEYMEQSPSVSRLFHIRMCSLLWSLLIVDVVCVIFVVEYVAVQRERSGLVLLFASEYIILFANLLGTIAKYAISWYDLRREEPWEAKSMYIFYVDLVIDGIKFLTYAAFFGLILSYYGFPINMLQNLYLTGRQFVHRLRDLVRYRAATRNMNERYPDATHVDMRSCDGVCIICRDEMHVGAEGTNPDAALSADGRPIPPAPQPSQQRVVNETPKKLPCGHIFHFQCLRSWLERQQSCPTCRRSVLPSDTTSATAVPAAAAAAPAQPAAAAAQPGALQTPAPQPGSAAPSVPRDEPTSADNPGAGAREARQALAQRPGISSTPRAAPREVDAEPPSERSAPSPRTRLLSFLDTLDSRTSDHSTRHAGSGPPLPAEVVHALLADPRELDISSDAKDTLLSSKKTRSSDNDKEAVWVLPHPMEINRTAGVIVSEPEAPSDQHALLSKPQVISPMPLDPREAARAAAIKRAERMMGRAKSGDSQESNSESKASPHSAPSTAPSDPKLARLLGGVTLVRQPLAVQQPSRAPETYLEPLFNVDESPEWTTEKASLPYPVLRHEETGLSSLPSSFSALGGDAMKGLGRNDQQLLDRSLTALAAAREQMREAQDGIDAVLEGLALRNGSTSSVLENTRLVTVGSAEAKETPELGDEGEKERVNKGKQPIEGIHASIS